MSTLDDSEKNRILDFLAELIENARRTLEISEASQKIKVSEASQKIKDCRSTKKLFAFFEQKNYHIVSLEEKSQIPREVSRLADLLTQNRKTLFPFTRTLLYSEDESFSAETADQETLTCLLNFCGCLEDREWIGYEYCKKEKMIKFERLDGFKGEAKVFLSGVFGEYGTVNLIERALQQFAKAKNGFKYKIFHDVKLKKTDSDKPHDIQLDLVVQLPEGFYIFETKTGQVLAVDKWVDRTRLFASEKNRFITCCADANLNPKIFKPFLLFNLDQLQEQLTDLLQKDYPGS